MFKYLNISFTNTQLLNILHWLIFHLNTTLFTKVVTKTDIKFTQDVIDDITEHITRSGNKEMMRVFMDKN
jgi:hypothetical protein